MNLLKEEIINSLREKCGQDAWVETVRLNYESSRYFYRTKDLIENDRIGEVVFAVERPDGRFITVRSKEYPMGVFRIPTGGISHGEDILEAVKREVSEELGLTADIVRFIGVYKIEISNAGEKVWFYSFFFHLKEKGGRLLLDASDDEVSEILEADSRTLYKLSDKLVNIEKDWKDWGAFRYLTTKAIADYADELNK